MNNLEERMLEILTWGRETGVYLGVKAEFEAEGTRTEEMIRLADIVRRSGLKFGIKIGGCEAVRDLLDCKNLGADYIIAPMVESPYALSKFVAMKDKIYTGEEAQHTEFLFNLETEQAFENLSAILDLAEDNIDGVVFGRVDYSASIGVERDAINSERIAVDCIVAAKACCRRALQFVVGGGISLESVDTLRKIRQERLTRFETRKIIFDAVCLEKIHGAALLEKAFAQAGEFELLWLKNKREHYGRIAQEDNGRIEMLEERYESAFAENAAA